MIIRKLYISLTLILSSLCVAVPVIADEYSYVAKQIDEDARNLASHGCYGAQENDYKGYLEGLKKDNLSTPDLTMYKQARCGDGNLILENTLKPGSYAFLKKFLREVHKKYGKKEVEKIINTPERVWGYTLLEEAIKLNRCRHKSPARGLSAIIKYLKKVGGTMRPGFCKVN